MCACTCRGMCACTCRCRLRFVLFVHLGHSCNGCFGEGYIIHCEELFQYTDSQGEGRFVAVFVTRCGCGRGCGCGMWAWQGNVS